MITGVTRGRPEPAASDAVPADALPMIRRVQLTNPDRAVLVALGGLGILIWARDLRWWAAWDDTLPILAALPLFYWLGRPWTVEAGSLRLAPGFAVTAAVLFALGIAADSGLILAAGWTALLWSWIAARFRQEPGTFRRKLLVLPLLSFPWMVTDFETVAWWFRLSGAVATAQLLHGFHLPVVREGTLLWCNGLAISVEPACSGVNGLQSMLVAGSALLYLKLRSSRLFWWNLPVLAGAAWLAHVFRIATAALCAVIFTPEVAGQWIGPIHAFTGWLGLVAGFAVCHAWFSLLAAWVNRPRPTPRPDASIARPWLNLTLLAYAAFCVRGLVASWRWAPYDRMAWLAFLIWLVPLFRPSPAKPAYLSQRHGTFLVAACGLLLVAAAADINAIYHVAFALALVGLYRRNGLWPAWAVGAIAWMPMAGWFGSRFGIEPAGFSVCRVAASIGATVCGLAGVRHRVISPPMRPTPVAAPTLLQAKPRHAD